MPITKKEIEHIADLARIKLSVAEESKMADELSSILDYVNKLNEISTENIEPTAQVTGLENIFREDKTGAVPRAETEKLLNQFPHKNDGYLKVRPVFENND